VGLYVSDMVIVCDWIGLKVVESGSCDGVN
jgi:hypothetical protein